MEDRFAETFTQYQSQRKKILIPSADKYNEIVKELMNRWSGCQIVHGRPRHSQSQGSVERANQDVERILCTQLREEKSTRVKTKMRSTKTKNLTTRVNRFEPQPQKIQLFFRTQVTKWTRSSRRQWS
ncbi:unnamed protein product, partial [Mesorhabditis belari]|uniref:Integrase catalytic domain-containing protein n=1 Tax=Mesorhabditis belari TaxID=2138241 RepID=A0AAF3FHT7_9BILA